MALNEFALVGSKFSILSVNNLPKVPMVEMIIVNTPAKGPGPTAITKMSTIIKLGITRIKESNHFVITLIYLLLKILLDAMMENIKPRIPPISVPK